MNNSHKNIFIEGLQGTGKSTLSKALSKSFPQYHVYQEGDISPVELAWCSYLTEEQFRTIQNQYPDLKEKLIQFSQKEDTHYIVAYTRILTDYPDFHSRLGNYEIYDNRIPYWAFHNVIMKRYAQFNTYGNIFECSFFQNSIECMILFYDMSDEDIIEFYKEAYCKLKDKNFRMLYLDSEDIKQNIEQIKKERVDTKGNEIWFSLMMKYLCNSPYGKAHHCEGIQDLIHHLEHRRALELRIIREVLKDNTLILRAKAYSEEEYFNFLKS